MKYKKTYRERIDRGDYAWRVVCYLESDENGLKHMFQWKPHRYGTILAAMAAKRDIERDMRRTYPNAVARILHHYPATVCEAQYDASTGPSQMVMVEHSLVQKIWKVFKEDKEYRFVMGKNPAFCRNEVYPFVITRPDKLTKVLHNLSNNGSAFSNQGKLNIYKR